jgi:hypothetical protein
LHIFLKIIGDSKEPQKFEYHGNYALELMFFKISYIYYGKEISNKIESAIKSRLSKDEEENNGGF